MIQDILVITGFFFTLPAVSFFTVWLAIKVTRELFQTRSDRRLDGRRNISQSVR
jgi:hypothetical protein